MEKIILFVDHIAPDGKSAKTEDYIKAIHNSEVIERHEDTDNKRVLMTDQDPTMSRTGIIGRFVFILVIDPRNKVGNVTLIDVRDDEREFNKLCNNLPEPWASEVRKAVELQRSEGFAPSVEVELLVTRPE